MRSTSSFNTGFSLIELLVSTAVLLMVFAASMTIFSFSLNLIGEARVRSMATNLAIEEMEMLRNIEYSNLGTVGGIPSGIVPQEKTIEVDDTIFNIYTSIVYVDDPFDGTGTDDPINTDYKRVRLEINWQGAFPSRQAIVFGTDISPPGLETLEGGGILQVSVADASGLPVEEAEVRIVNDEVDPVIDTTLVTPETGVITLPGAPACVDCYSITASKSGYTSDRTYSTDEVANPNKPDATVIEGELSQLSLNIDRTSQITFYTTGSREANFPPFAGVQFRLRGSRTIGTDTQDQPIYLYDQALTSGPGGVLTVSNLPWDTYQITIPNPSSVDLAGTKPLSPFSLEPNAQMDLRLVTTPSSTNNLLTKVADLNGNPIATASVTLSATSSAFIATQSAGLSDDPDTGQTIFKNLSAEVYQLLVTHPDYQQATASAEVLGDSLSNFILEPNED